MASRLPSGGRGFSYGPLDLTPKADRLCAHGWGQIGEFRLELITQKSLAASNKLPPPPPSQILAKTSYDMSTHAAESTGWINVLFAQVS